MLSVARVLFAVGFSSELRVNTEEGALGEISQWILKINFWLEFLVIWKYSSGKKSWKKPRGPSFESFEESLRKLF